MLLCTHCGNASPDSSKFCTNCGAALKRPISQAEGIDGEKLAPSNPLKVFLLKNGQQDGPYEQSTVEEWLRTGQCSADDLAWYEGLSDWQPLGALLQSERRGGVSQEKSRSDELVTDATIRMVLRLSDPDNPISREDWNELTDQAISLLEESLRLGRGEEEFSTRCLLASLCMDKLGEEEFEHIRTKGIQSQPDGAKALSEYEKALSMGLADGSLFLSDLEKYSDYFYNLGNLWSQHALYLSSDLDTAISYAREKTAKLASIGIYLPHLCGLLGSLMVDIDRQAAAEWFQRAINGNDFDLDVLKDCKRTVAGYLDNLINGTSPVDPHYDPYNRALDHYNRGMEACTRGDLDCAIEEFDSCLSMDPAPVVAMPAWFNLGVAIHNRFCFGERKGEMVSNSDMRWCQRISYCASRTRELFETHLIHGSTPEVSQQLEHIYSEAKDLQNRYMFYGLMYFDPVSTETVTRDFDAVRRESVPFLRCFAEYEREQQQKAEQEMIIKRRETGECEICGTKLRFFEKAGGNLLCKAHR